jgi:thiol-disulfide isomerase/thioredoxin
MAYQQQKPLVQSGRLINFLVVAAAYWSQIDAFSTSSVISRPTTLGPFTTRSASRNKPLFVVADVPNREEEKKRFNDDDDDDDDDHNDGAWVKTRNGGFLPKIPQILKDRIGRQTIPEQVLTLQEYKAVVADEKERIVCVRFYAPWCKACKAVQAPFRKLCRDYPSVKFVELPLTQENAFLHDGLGVPSLPYGHIYHPTAGLVEERKIKKNEFAQFAKVLETYVQGKCSVEYSENGDTCRQGSPQSLP